MRLSKRMLFIDILLDMDTNMNMFIYFCFVLEGGEDSTGSSILVFHNLNASNKESGSVYER